MKHHYIPQFLLSGWAELCSDGKLEVFRLDLTNLCSYRRKPKYTGFDDNLYALSEEVVAGMEKQAIEKKFLMNVDNRGAIVRSKLIDNGLSSLSNEDRVDRAS